MPQNSYIRLSLFYLISVGFIVLNLWFVINKDMLILSALPVILLILLAAIYSFDKIIYLVVFFAPLSIPLHEIMPGFGFDMYLPTEPLLFGLLIVFLLKVLSERKFDRKILLHPVSLAIYLNLFWLLVTGFTSTMPIVSFKFILARIWFVVVLFLLTAKLFSEGKNIEKYIWAYIIPFIIVVFYATFRHLGYGLWDKQAAHYVVSPFYNDHTSYGAASAIFLPILAVFMFNKDFSRRLHLISIGVFAIVLMSFVLSYARAAWLSIVVAIGVWIIILLKIRFKPIFIAFLALVALFFTFQTQILMKLESNSKESSANLATHISSMSNITSDASNLERINRWSCAIRMFEDKPVFGFGPGTYMFQYAPYQLNKDRTIISTNAGDGGNAHSEYLGPLAESGVLGLLTFLLLIIVVIYTGVNAYTRIHDRRLKQLVLGALLGLITYYIHGFLNNFLDTDKLSVPFWGFTAIIVAVDIISKKQEIQEQSQE